MSFGGSTDTGLQNNAPFPAVFRTNVATTGNLAIGPEFLAVNKNVLESGLRTFWSLYMAYYSSVSRSSPSGRAGTTATESPIPKYHTRVPVQSFYVMGGYFLTGERREQPRHRPGRCENFDFRPGKVGPGAIELIARYNYLNIGNNIFTAGLADPSQWTNQLFTTDLGVNWYWTQYIKVYMGWRHAGFGNPVSFARSGFRRRATSTGCGSRSTSEAFPASATWGRPRGRAARGRVATDQRHLRLWLDIPRSQPDSGKTAPEPLRLRAWRHCTFYLGAAGF